MRLDLYTDEAGLARLVRDFGPTMPGGHYVEVEFDTYSGQYWVRLTQKQVKQLARTDIRARYRPEKEDVD